jgi:hypothetical protein
VILVSGARRTGTTLLSAVLSADPRTPPFPGESQLLTRWIEDYRWAREHFAIGGLPFFGDTGALKSFHLRMVSLFLDHCREHFAPADIVILKSPEFSLHWREVLELLPDADIVVSVRDPLDQVASEWQVLERRRAPTDLAILASRDFASLARLYVRYYGEIVHSLESASRRIVLQRYEELVLHHERAARTLGAALDLDLSSFDPSARWPRIARSYWAYGSSPSDTPYYGGPLARDRVGAHAAILSPDEAEHVRRICAEVTSRLGYGSEAGKIATSSSVGDGT